MLKKSLAIFLFFPSLSFANPYLGIGAGPEFADFNQSIRFMNPFSNVKENTHYAGNGIFGSFFGGYGGTYQRYYLGGEINLDGSSVTFKTSNTEFNNGTVSNSSYRVQNNFGISLMPGYVVKENTLLYGRLGYNNGNIKISTTDSSLQSINRRISGFRYGVGLNETFTEHFQARIEYNNTSYQNTSFTVMPGFNTKNTNISPIVSQFQFALIYVI